MSNEKIIGAYVCSGCAIGDRLDTGQLAMTAMREGKVSFCRTHDFLCSLAGVAMIQKDIDDGEASHIVIAACSPRSKSEAFSFDNVAVARANLREGVIWIRPHDDGRQQQTTQEMANDYVRMACAEVHHIKFPWPSQEQSLNRTVVIVGGGITGITAALETAKAGYRVELVEKTAALGGWMARMHRAIPTRSPYSMPQETGLEAMIAAVNSHDNINVYLNASVAKTEGAPGRFSVKVALESGPVLNVEAGAVIQATGWKEYDAARLPEFAYHRSADIITSLELEALAKEAGDGPIRRRSDGKAVSAVVFIQNVGQSSSAKEHLPYHSGIGDMIAIKQSLYFKLQNKACDTTIIHNHLRTAGVAGEDFYRSGQKKGVTFIRGSVTEVVAGNEIQVRFRDMILDEDTRAMADLVVLDTGMIPNSGPDPHAAPVAMDDEAPIEVMVDSILNLEYRQGSDLPQLKYGFTDSNFVCFPYETRRTGIYSAGCVRRPMDSYQAKEDAMGAAMKAIQALENASRGQSAHPRSGDLSYPVFRKQGCTRCKRCTVECPFAAINEDDIGYPLFNESRCRRCGICMGACPVRVISFDNYSVDTVGKQIESVDIPHERDEKPRILVLACENDAYPALDMAAHNRIENSPFARIVPVRCLGSVNTVWVTDALNSGYDAVVLMGCSKGGDYQCHFVKGSEMAQYRMSKISDTLQALGLEEERVATYEVAITDIQRAPRLIDEMVETIRQIGMSPYKF